MCERLLGVAVAVLVITVSPASCWKCGSGRPTCEIGNPDDYVEGRCPVKMTTVQYLDYQMYFECVSVHVWMKAGDDCPTITIQSRSIRSKVIRPIIRKRKKKEKCAIKEKQAGCQTSQVQQRRHNDSSLFVWELVHNVDAQAGEVVSVIYSTTSTNCSVNYTVQDPIPSFDLTVNPLSKSINVTVTGDWPVSASWCYRNNALCIGGKPLSTINPTQSRSALLNIPYMLPCVCVQVYYTYRDSRRHRKCPLLSQSLADVRDVWLSSKVVLRETSLRWVSECPARYLNVSASLCWRQHEHLCTSAPNSTLEADEGGQDLKYNTSAVDKHPQMCIQFFLQGSFNISCPFRADMSSWEVYMGPGRQSVFLYLTSSTPASFSAQLCVLKDKTCTPVGEIYSVSMDGKTPATKMKVPVYYLADKPCVQVWRSDPSLNGKRILCPDYTHNRYALYAVVALIFAAVGAFMGTLIHRLKIGTAGWLCIQKPVLLVCSSDQSAHVSAVCALASILQEELSATVHMALWALSSKAQFGARTGVADLGPFPWLYGQWEAVRKSQGRMLIVWSPEAKKTYEKWREVRTKNEKKDSSKSEGKREKIQDEVEECAKLNEKRAGNCEKEKDDFKFCDDKDTQREHSTVIAPVFMAALSCLEGALQRRQGHGVAFVYFQGLCNSKDIPKTFRRIPRYCLPQDFRGLIQELGGMKRQTKNGKFSWHCWSRLISKVLSVWLAKQLAQRLQTLLPHTGGKKMPSITTSRKLTLDKTRGKLRLSLAADMARTGAFQDHEPLHSPPQRAEKLSSQVSRV